MGRVSSFFIFLLFVISAPYSLSLAKKVDRTSTPLEHFWTEHHDVQPSKSIQDVINSDSRVKASNANAKKHKALVDKLQAELKAKQGEKQSLEMKNSARSTDELKLIERNKNAYQSLDFFYDLISWPPDGDNDTGMPSILEERGTFASKLQKIESGEEQLPDWKKPIEKAYYENLIRLLDIETFLRKSKYEEEREQVRKIPANEEKAAEDSFWAKEFFVKMQQSGKCSGWLWDHQCTPEEKSKELQKHLDALKNWNSLLEARMKSRVSSLPSSIGKKLIGSLGEMAPLFMYGDEDDAEDLLSYFTNKGEIEAMEEIIKVRSEMQALGMDDTFEESTQKAAKVDKEIEEIEGKIEAAKRDWNYEAYMSLANACLTISDEMGKLADEKTRDLRVAFKQMMMALESFELDLSIEYNSKFPYPKVSWLKTRAELVKSKFFSPAMPSKMDLVKYYYVARLGPNEASRWRAYWSSIKNATWKVGSAAKAAVLGKFFDVDLRKKLADINDSRKFAQDNPLIASRVSANLFEAYRILSREDKGLASNLWDQFRTLYAVAEVKNIVTDGLWGGDDYRYSSINPDLAPLGPEVLTLIDVAEKAPLVANMIAGAQERSSTGRVVSTVFWVGSLGVAVAGWYFGAPVLASSAGVLGTGTGVLGLVSKKVGGVFGGVFDYAVTQSLAEQISRDNELLINGLIRGFETFKATGSYKDAAVTFAKYQLARKAIKTIGEGLRAQHEGKSGWSVLTDQLSCVKDDPAAAVSGAGAGGIIGIVAGGLAMTAATSIGALVALPVAAAGICAVGISWIAKRVKDKIEPQRVVDRQHQKTGKDLERIQTQFKESEKKQNEAMIEAIKMIDRSKIEEKMKGVPDKPQTQGYLEKWWKFYQEEIEANLAKLEEKQSLEIAGKMPKLKDPQLDPVVQSLDSNPQKALQLFKDYFGKEDELSEAEKALADNLKSYRENQTPELLGIIERQLKLLRINQIKEGVANKAAPAG